MKRLPIKIAVAVLMAGLTLVATAARTQRANERVLFENAHIRFIEVTNWPGEKALMTDERYPAVLATDAAWPAVTDRPLDKTAAQNGGASNAVRPPLDKAYPWCRTQTAQSPHEVTVTGAFPMHFYRIDYKRIDGEEYVSRWKEWYPWMLDPVKQAKDFGKTPLPGKPFSKEWPYPIAYNATDAAPANHFMRYEDEHVQLLEVVIRGGEKENMHGHPYYSVFAADLSPVYVAFLYDAAAVQPYLAQLQAGGGGNDVLDSRVPDAHGLGSSPPPGMNYPVCQAALPEAPHQAYLTNKEWASQHFYRIQFKRIDGDEIKMRWREWYPRAE